MNQLFKYGENEVRTVMVEGKSEAEPWFVAKDVAEILGYRMASDMTRNLDDDEKGTQNVRTVAGEQSVTVINESGLYSAIISSRKPEARAFKRWVTSEVLPAIRKHGGYLTPEKVEEALLNPDTIIQLATQLKTERAERQRLEMVTAEQAPKVNYYDQILASEGTLLVSQIAKDYGLTAQELNLVLKAEGVQYKRGNQWLLTAAYARQGYTDSQTMLIDETISVMNTKWTQAGRIFIHRLLASKGIRPETGPDAIGAEYLRTVKQAEADRKNGKKKRSVNVLVRVK
ncbi:phage antirepressor [Paenibacillus sp. J5C_2022]|uniref:phage antirepressor n=1 Tax=Paenibacillus sp. J5C2022 TaxID=2977129 RepID=UPI0021D0DC6E|nr:phage antirepressor [Paenibacillus sp. J5C2022]MCU6709295.1 phage antirepressor [Paenibacillus sp. J5C2022]